MKKQFTKKELDEARAMAIMLGALFEIQVSPHALRCELREGGNSCDCHVKIADEAVRKAKELVGWK